MVTWVCMVKKSVDTKPRIKFVFQFLALLYGYNIGLLQIIKLLGDINTNKIN